jgi:hypothetical protein
VIAGLTYSGQRFQLHTNQFFGSSARTLSIYGYRFRPASNSDYLRVGRFVRDLQAVDVFTRLRCTWT